MAWLKSTRPFWLKCCCSGSCWARLFGGSLFALVALLFCRLVAGLGAAFVLLSAFRLLAAAGLAVVLAVMGSGASFGGLDGLLPSLYGLAFGGLEVDYLLDCYIGNGNLALFLAAILLFCFFRAGLCLAALVLLSALRLGFTALVFFAALRLRLTAFSFLLMLSAAGLLQGNQHLGGLHQLGADNLLAFDNKGLGAYRLCIQSLGILDNQGGDFIGAGNDCTYFLLAAAAGGGNEGCTNSANKE